MLPQNLKILKKFGRSPLTGRDFRELASANKIEVVLSSEAPRGFYYYARGSHSIVLPSNLSGNVMQLVGWHEFAHFLQNATRPSTAAAFCGLKDDAPGERLANVFARIATRPDLIRITGPLDFVRMIMETPL